MRWAAKKDDNHKDVVAALRACGWSVDVINGEGTPDLLVGVQVTPLFKINLLLEVKDGKKVASARALTPAQVKWHRNWHGQKAIVESPAEAVQYVIDYRNALQRMLDLE